MTDQLNVALLVLRVAAGLMIMRHGYAHIFKKGKLNIKGTAGWFGSMGMRPPLFHAWLASITELGSGALLVLGLFTPLAAGALFGTMFVAFMIEHRKRGFFIYNPGQGWEYVAIIMALCVGVGTLGAGDWSLDNAFDVTLWHDWRGLLTVVVVGLGGSIATLAACWRPSTKS